MSKWADFGISAVRFNSAHTHIDRVRINPDNGESIGAAQDCGRADVVASIKRKVTFITIFKNAAGNWSKGQPVFIDVVGGVEYLKTVANGKAVDNLDNLPEY
jgi:hypothetical protein